MAPQTSGRDLNPQSEQAGPKILDSAATGIEKNPVTKILR